MDDTIVVSGEDNWGWLIYTLNYDHNDLFHFHYYKDYTISGGLDTVWLDNMYFKFCCFEHEHCGPGCPPGHYEDTNGDC